MSARTQARQPEGIPTGGQFAPDAHTEPALVLAAPRGYDPEDVALGILEDLRKLPVEWTRELYYGTHKAVQDGETTYEEFLDGLIAKNHGGRCKRHEYDRFDTERYCHDCLTSLMVEARTNDKPLPVPLTAPPGPADRVYLDETDTSTEDFHSEHSSTTSTIMSGDEKFYAAVRRMYNAPADAPVEIVQEEWRDWQNYTEESGTTIKVNCDGKTHEFEGGLGELMRAMDKELHPEPREMALRFMRADSAKRPLLNGIAAVYLRNGDYGTPRPVFGKIRNVFLGGSEASMDFLHTDGRQEYLRFNQVVSILETDQSSEYNEDPNILPASAARPGTVIEKSIEPYGGKREVRAIVTTAELDAQVRGYLHVDDPAAGVTVRHEKVDFYGIEEKFVLNCDGKETSFSSLEAFLREVAN